MQIFSFSPFGYDGALVTVEVDIRRGIPAVDIVGLADGAVKESRERMRIAVKNSGFEFPPERVLISLSPADLKKEGAGFDLAIAIALLQARNENVQEESDESILVMGELELSGNVRAVRAVHAAASTAFANGIVKCIVPVANADEAREVLGMKVYGADNLKDAFASLSDSSCFTDNKALSEKSFVPSGCTEIEAVLFPPINDNEFAEVIGQKHLVRALQIAAAGSHNLIAVGSPGCGKTMAIQKMQSLIPLLTVEEAQPVTRIYSIAGLMNRNEPLKRIAPFRQPHQTASIEGMCGGGHHCIPGEISLAHNGALFLDEAAEYKTSVLQMLRVPIESGSVTLARAGRSTTYPASFQLLMASNPCPCGNFGSKSNICLCSARAIEMYWNKFSAPLLDRIDIRVHVDNEIIGLKESKENNTHSISTNELRKKIAIAIKKQRERQGSRNSHLCSHDISKYCSVSKNVQAILDKAILKYSFSPRAISSCLKIARTIADMEGDENINEYHIEEAIFYRKECSDFLYK